MNRFCFLLALAMHLVSVAAVAQQPAPLDTARVYELETAVVTADRSPGVVSTSTASVSVLQTADLQVLPLNGLQDALETTPGFAFLQPDGLGYNPQVSVRGFYGGGEATYVVVLLDGKPLNQMEQGLVNWNLVPLAEVKKVEVVRGGPSSLYGDSAIGSVINLVTHEADQDATTRFDVQGGSFGILEGGLSHSGHLGERAYRVFGNARRLDGFRAHSGRLAGSLGGALDLVRTSAGSLTLSTLNYWRQFDDPGPLTDEERAADRRQESLFYRFDGTDERTNRLSLDAAASLGAVASVTAALTGELRHTDVVRTLPLAPGFFDTKNRELDAARVLATAQATVAQLPLDGRLVVGFDASRGVLDSDYYTYLTGPEAVYQGNDPGRGELDRSGRADRTAAAGFGQVDLQPATGVRFTLGARADWIRDTYDPALPADDESTATNAAFSPKVGLNVRYLSRARNVGNLYATVARSFKAPTLDQLYDQRTYPVGPDIPPITISNPELNPQTGVSLEAGLYHRATLSPGRLDAEVSLAVYQIDMKDELDFDFATFRFVNIAESRHRGVESGLRLYVQQGVSAFINYTYQGVTAKTGDFVGKFVKAIPRDFISAGLSVRHGSGVNGSVKLASARRIFLDDANTVSLPDYTTLDARIGYQIGRFGLSVDVFNLLDERYSTTGFPVLDPVSGSNVILYYPAAGRHVRAGVRVEL